MNRPGLVLMIVVLLPGILLAGCCGSLNSACNASSTCCSHACEGAEPGFSGRCCAPEGYNARMQADCCAGLVYAEAAGRCMEPAEACEAGGCTWTERAVAGGGSCDCHPGEDTVVIPPTCEECELATTCPAARYVYELEVCPGDCSESFLYGPFWASSPARAEECAAERMRALGCVNYPAETEGMHCQSHRRT